MLKHSFKMHSLCFLAVLGLRCCVRAFWFAAKSGGFSAAAVAGFIAVAPRALELRFSTHGTQELSCPVACGMFLDQDRTRVSCTGFFTRDPAGGPIHPFLYFPFSLDPSHLCTSSSKYHPSILLPFNSPFPPTGHMQPHQSLTLVNTSVLRGKLPLSQTLGAFSASLPPPSARNPRSVSTKAANGWSRARARSVVDCSAHRPSIRPDPATHLHVLPLGLRPRMVPHSRCHPKQVSH